MTLQHFSWVEYNSLTAGLGSTVQGNIPSVTRRGMVKESTKYADSDVINQALVVESGSNLSNASNGISGISVLMKP